MLTPNVRLTAIMEWTPEVSYWVHNLITQHVGDSTRIYRSLMGTPERPNYNNTPYMSPLHWIEMVPNNEPQELCEYD